MPSNTASRPRKRAAWCASASTRCGIRGLLYISVCDNGVGIRPEQLAQLKAALAQPGERWEHIGIYNVAARLRLLDRNSRFVIRSHPGRGTAVVLYLPLVENEEEFEE